MVSYVAAIINIRIANISITICYYHYYLVLYKSITTTTTITTITTNE